VGRTGLAVVHRRWREDDWHLVNGPGQASAPSAAAPAAAASDDRLATGNHILAAVLSCGRVRRHRILDVAVHEENQVREMIYWNGWWAS
jgi:hypothetical protein